MVSPTDNPAKEGEAEPPFKIHYRVDSRLSPVGNVCLKAYTKNAVQSDDYTAFFYFRTLDLKHILLPHDSPGTVSSPVAVLFAGCSDDIDLHTTHLAMLHSAFLS